AEHDVGIGLVEDADTVTVAERVEERVRGVVRLETARGVCRRRLVGRGATLAAAGHAPRLELFPGGPPCMLFVVQVDRGLPERAAIVSLSAALAEAIRPAAASKMSPAAFWHHTKLRSACAGRCRHRRG